MGLYDEVVMLTADPKASRRLDAYDDDQTLSLQGGSE